MHEKVEVLIYSKPGCHLCEEMQHEISRADCGELYSIQEINIESDPDLLSRYKNDIPVLMIDGVEAFRHRLKAEQFKEKLLAAQKQPFRPK